MPKDTGLWYLLLILLLVAAIAVLATWLLALLQQGRRRAGWKYLPAALSGAGTIASWLQMIPAVEGFADLAWFLSGLLALTATLVGLLAALLLGRHKRKHARSVPPPP